MRKSLLGLGLLLAMTAACSAADDGAVSAEAPLSMADFDTVNELYRVSKGELSFGGPAVTGTGAYLSFTFWANEGEEVRLHVSGAPSFDVQRVAGHDYCKSESTELAAQFVLTNVASGTSDATFTAARTGAHFVVVGAPDATTTSTVSVSADVTRRPFTTGVRAVSTELAKTCAVLANGEAKCWGTTRTGWSSPGTRAGTTLASMGAGLATIALPAKAVDVALVNTGEYTTTSFLLEDGSVWSALEEAPLQAIALAGKAKKVSGTCAWLEDDGVQCWSYDTNAVSAVQHFAKPVKSMSATSRNHVVLLEGDEVAQDGKASAALQLDAGEHVLDVSQRTFDACVLTNRAVRCGQFASGAHEDGYLFVAEVPGDVVQFLADAVEDSVVVTKDGTVYAMSGDGWTQRDHGVVELNGASWKKDRMSLYFQNGGVKTLAGTNAMARDSQCAITSDGILKCAGAINVGQLGVGDCIDRTSPSALANLPGLLLE